MRRQHITRVVPADDRVLREQYGELIDRLGNPEVVETAGNVYCFRGNDLCQWITEEPPMGGGLSLQDMEIAYRRGHFTLQEYMGFYMGLGVSLSHFLTTFGERLGLKVWHEADVAEDDG